MRWLPPPLLCAADRASSPTDDFAFDLALRLPCGGALNGECRLFLCLNAICADLIG